MPFDPANASRRPTTRANMAKRLLFLESLEKRDVPTTAVFSAGVLAVFGDSAANDITIVVNGGLVEVVGVTIVNGPVSIANVTGIFVDGAGAGDTIDLRGVSRTAGFTGLSAIYATGQEPNSSPIGTDGNDLIFGASDISGVDQILEGALGDDTIFGGDNNDSIVGGYLINANNFSDAVGADFIDGGAGNDSVYGDDEAGTGAGNDIIFGRDGADSLRSGLGNDFLDGGDGNDAVVGTDQSETDTSNDTLLGGTGADTLFAGLGNDYLDGGDDDDILNADGVNAFDSGNDTLLGGRGNDSLISDLGNDLLDGGAGNDFLVGAFNRDASDSDDTLIGGTGNDSMFGGHGNDWYLFADNWGRDFLRDLGGLDSIDFRAASVDLVFGSNIEPPADTPDMLDFETDEMDDYYGGTGDDVFRFGASASFGGGQGLLDGSFGTNTLDYSAYGAPVMVTFADGFGVAAGIYRFYNIQQVVGASIFGVPPAPLVVSSDQVSSSMSVVTNTFETAAERTSMEQESPSPEDRSHDGHATSGSDAIHWVDSLAAPVFSEDSPADFIPAIEWTGDVEPADLVASDQQASAQEP